MRFRRLTRSHVISPKSLTRSLEGQRARGALLHYFANHELLAMELMALALLRFPQAPSRFRQELALNLREERNHLCMYLKRMQSLGIEFGDLPVNDFFWRHLSTMQSPLQFLCVMSLTFEQANLDYMHHYCQVFEDIGDTLTANIFKKILADEIGHVRTGVDWFSHFSKKTLNWQNYTMVLPKTLNPIRARGSALNIKARQQCGFDRNYLQAIKDFRYSRGRPSAVLWFDPICEEYLADPEFKAPPLLKQLRHDLSSLMIFLASPEDIVVLPYKPSSTFIEQLEEIGISQVEFLSSPPERKLSLGERKLGDLKPWGWSPQAKLYAKPIREQIVGPADKALSALWQHPMTSKIDSVSCLNDFLLLIKEKQSQTKTEQISLCPIESVGKSCRNLDEVYQAARQFHSRFKSASLLVKAPWGAAGRRMFRLAYQKNNKNVRGELVITEKQRQWLQENGKAKALLLLSLIMRIEFLTFPYSLKFCLLAA